jgi:hypothetical protein
VGRANSYWWNTPSGSHILTNTPDINVTLGPGSYTITVQASGSTTVSASRSVYVYNGGGSC